jgi:hypothetical protein
MSKLCFATATGMSGPVDGWGSSGRGKGRVGGASAITRRVEQDAVEARCGRAAATGTCGGGRDAVSDDGCWGSGGGGGSAMGARCIP